MPKMKYKGKFIKGMHKWIENCRSKWFFKKNYISFWKRLRELNLSIMIVSSHKTVSIKSIINGGKRCRSLLGCSTKYCLKGYWKDL
jgi:hypothetical protein